MEAERQAETCLWIVLDAECNRDVLGSKEDQVPSRNGLPQIGHESACLRDFFGTRSSSRYHQLTCSVALCEEPNRAIHIPSRKPSLTPFTSLGGLSASASKLSINVSSKLPPPSCLILRKASDRVMKTARISAGIGVALLFCVVEVLTSSRFEKKVERSGRRVC